MHYILGALCKIYTFAKKYSTLSTQYGLFNPSLSEVHVEGEVHELLAELPDAEHVQGDAHL